MTGDNKSCHLAIAGLLDRNYRHKSVATQTPDDGSYTLAENFLSVIAASLTVQNSGNK